jgi:hypothetical protein
LVRKEQKFGRQLWGLLCLELWFRAFVDGERVPRPRFAEPALAGHSGKESAV